MIDLIISLITLYLPIENAILRTQIAVLLGNIFSKLTLPKISWFRPNEVIIFNRDENSKPNPIYYKLEEYLTKKYLVNIKACELLPKKGEISFSIYDNINSKFSTVYQEKKIDIRFDKLEDKEHNVRRALVFSSKKAPLELLKEYVSYICKLTLKNHNNVITIYRPIAERIGKGKDKELHIDWDTIYIRTNKTRDNTIYSDEINKEFFDDVEWFLKNEGWYGQRGIPYKRGYVCHGIPGGGKTSLAKIIANQYSLPIFMVDLGVIQDNSDLVRLVTGINYLAKDSRYIMLMEDVDRSDIMQHRYDRRGDLTPDCLLNVLDGVVETHGRICILTANNVSVLESIPALMRAGRIDKKLELGYCTEKQIATLIKIFYPEIDFESMGLDIQIQITPAELVKMMLDYHRDPETVLEKIQEATTVQTDEVHDLAGPGGYGRSRRRLRRRPDPVARKKRDIKYIEKQIAKLPKLKEALEKEEEKAKKRKEREKARKEKAKKRKTQDKAGKILNPATGRYVKKTGSIGRKLVRAQASQKPQEESNEEEEESEEELEVTVRPSATESC